MAEEGFQPGGAGQLNQLHDVPLPAAGEPAGHMEEQLLEPVGDNPLEQDDFFLNESLGTVCCPLCLSHPMEPIFYHSGGHCFCNVCTDALTTRAAEANPPSSLFPQSRSSGRPICRAKTSYIIAVPQRHEQSTGVSDQDDFLLKESLRTVCCPLCLSHPMEPIFYLSCGHCFCNVCTDALTTRAAEANPPPSLFPQSRSSGCPICRAKTSSIIAVPQRHEQSTGVSDQLQNGETMPSSISNAVKPCSDIPQRNPIPSGVLLTRGATAQHVDDCFESTPQDKLLEVLAETRWWWKYDDLSRLNLSERLTSCQIYELLKTTIDGIPLLHHGIMKFNIQLQETILLLLGSITDQDQLFELFSMKNDRSPRNYLHIAVTYSQSETVRYISTRLNEDELYRLLLGQDEHGDTALHLCMKQGFSNGDLLQRLTTQQIFSLLSIKNNEGNTALHNVSKKDYLLEKLLSAFTMTEFSQLLSMRNGNGHTVLASSIILGLQNLFISVMELYSNSPCELLEIAATVDREGNTALHHATSQNSSFYLKRLIQAMYEPQSRTRFIEFLASNEQASPDWKSKAMSSNQVIYQWALECARKRQYMLFDDPKVIIISISRDCPEAEEEAQTLSRSFVSLGFKVTYKNDLRKDEVLGEIGKTARAKDGLIVAIVSHGTRGHIFSHESEPIAITDIENSMVQHSPMHMPKLLILQCCQITWETTTDDIGDPSAINKANQGLNSRSYSPSSPDFCFIMSTGPGWVSTHKSYIVHLAEALEELEPTDDISTWYNLAIMRLPKKQPSSQSPVRMTSMTYKFCIKNILPLVLKRNQPEFRSSYK